MVSPVRLTDHVIARRREVVGIRRRCIVLERLVVRVVVRLRITGQRGVRRAAASTGGIGGLFSRTETTLEPAPRDVLFVELVADVLGVHRGDLVGASGGTVGAVVVQRIWVSHHGGGLSVFRNTGQSVVLAIFDGLLLTRGRVMHRGTSNGSCNKVQRARRRWTENSGERIIVHGEVLRIVPHAGNGVAIVVAHGQAGGAVGLRVILVIVYRHSLRELVHLSAVVGLLLIGVVVVLVRSHSLLWGETERLSRVRVLISEQVIVLQVVDLRGAFLGLKFRGILFTALQLLAVFIEGIRVRCEVVIEGNILRVNDHDVLDGGRRGS